MSKTQRLYDMVFLVVPEKDEQGVLATVDEFRKLLVDNPRRLYWGRQEA